MTQHESAHEETEDRFYAQFDSREVELMTLDELAVAFEEGRIHENTFVCREGESEWCTLADVAGLGEEEEEEAPLVAPALETRPPMPHRQPELVAAAGETRPPMPQRQPEPVATGETRPPMPSRRPEMNTVPAQRFAAQSIAPAAQVQSSPALSYAPVTSNISDSALDLDDLSLRPKRRWGLVAAAAGVLALAGGGTVFALGNSSALASNSALDSAATHSAASLSMASLPKPSEPAAAPAPVPSTPEPAAAAPAAPEPASDAPKAASSAGFSDDMKAALLAADKAHADKHAKKVKASAGKVAASAPRHGKAAGSGGGLKSGGSAYDPLNGKL